MLGERLRRRDVSMSRRMTAAVAGNAGLWCVLIEKARLWEDGDTASEAERGDKGNKGRG